ncbi:cilia- and flagella-associated protein 119 isoform X2 [Scyliorhinus torazame]|uniref:cilia- and flagella-associated protein 119 isoform X2 n=1 Tax=Scyliorhinus torazame TaxID=75743 RepID=UPI003B5A8B0D
MASKRLEKPKLPDAKICLWALHQLLCLSLNESDYRSHILLDLYVYTIQFAKNQAFNKEQTSTLFSIVKRLHEACTATSLGNVDGCFHYFLELVLCHSVRRPPFSIDLFNSDQVKLVTDYILDTYFRHFKLYKYVFTRQILLDLTISYPGIPDPQPDVEEEELVIEQEEDPPEEMVASGELSPPEQPDQELQQYIRTRLTEQVSELKTSLESQLREGEQRLNQRLLSLEALSPSGSQVRSPRGKRK